MYLEIFDRSKEVIEYGDGMCTYSYSIFEAVYKSVRDDESESGEDQIDKKHTYDSLLLLQ